MSVELYDKGEGCLDKGIEQNNRVEQENKVAITKDYRIDA